MTSTGFVFNQDGLLISYINTYNLNISPQKISITYDAQKRISSFEVRKTQQHAVVKAGVLYYHGDTVKLVHPKNLMQPVISIFNSDSNMAGPALLLPTATQNTTTVKIRFYCWVAMLI